MINLEKWIDLTVLIDENYLEYPGDIPFSITKEKEFQSDGLNMARLNTNMHVGTHLDAPKHALDTNLGIESIDINKLINKAQVITPTIKDNIILTSSISQQYTKGYTIILLNLEFTKYLNTPKYFDFPRFERSILEFFKQHHIEVIGFDMPSPLYEDETLMEMHKDLLSHHMTILENLTNLSILTRYVDLIALPLKIKGLDGSLIRCVAKNIKND